MEKPVQSREPPRGNFKTKKEFNEMNKELELEHDMLEPLGVFDRIPMLGFCNEGEELEVVKFANTFLKELTSDKKIETVTQFTYKQITDALGDVLGY